MNLTFCINTARNERYHVDLLLRSMAANLSRKDYPIIVYVENDNQGTVEFLKTQKAIFPNLKIVVNPLPIPIGYARNINLMFEMAETEVVSYLQSDMVVCKNYDLEVLKHLNESNIISSTRIEPPLHPESPEKITHDFGLDPQNFNLDAFTTFADGCKQDRITNYWFAPFTLYKKHWLEIGGHDTLFRRSREDSDLLYRFTMKGLKIEQAWNAIVYHFTCTSSRGIEWWTEKAQARTRLQQHADMVEMTRFLQKWPTFKHDTTFNAETEYKYWVSANFTNVTPENAGPIMQNYYRFQSIYIDNPVVRKQLRESFDKFHDIANELLNISPENWALYRKYYRTIKPEDIFVDAPLKDDVVLNIDITKGVNIFNDVVIVKINDIIHENRGDLDFGSFALGDITVDINDAPVNNHIHQNLVVKNPPIDDIKFTIL
jgi:GT2 family glycosyltransferase